MTKDRNNRSSHPSSTSSSPTSSPNETRIDLGDDLLEKTGVLSGSGPRPSTETGGTDESIDSRIHSARILIGEGLLEQAKKLLHAIMIEDPRLVEPRRILEELHNLELKQIFGESSGRFFRRDKKGHISLSPEDVLEQLDRDLSLGIGRPDLPAMLRDAESLRQLSARLEAELGDVSSQDRVDIGIGFLEMGLADLAIPQFRAALQVFSRNQNPDPTDLISATALIAVALIAAVKPLDAEFALQPLLNDSEIPRESKVELFYLMGRVQEQLGKTHLAIGWFEQVAEINPMYRDVSGRLAKTR